MKRMFNFFFVTYRTMETSFVLCNMYFQLNLIYQNHTFRRMEKGLLGTCKANECICI